MQTEPPLVKPWKTPELTIISQNTVNSGSHAGHHENSILNGRGNPGPVFVYTFSTPAGTHALVNNGPALAFYHS